MNILMFVMTMLMILTILTYAKLESFRSATGLQRVFENYMQHMERQYINDAAEEQYDSIHLKRNGPNGERGAPARRSTAKATLPIGILLDDNAEAKTSEEYQYTASILKTLAGNLYGSYDFFKNAHRERPDFMDEIIIHLPEAKKEAGTDFKITKAKDLANLNLGDPFLNEIFYLMLKGSLISYQNPQGVIVEEGFPSLLKYINSSKGKQVRVFLAPKPLLQVLFDPASADEIIATREHFYREVRNDTMDAGDATERFEAMFVTKVNPLVPLKSLDFSISKTDPVSHRQ